MSTTRSFTRRGFLRRTAAVAAAAVGAPVVVPSSVLGADGKVAPSNRVTVGMIALGRQAIARNLPVFLRWPDSQVVALCDPDRFRLAFGAEGGKRYGGTKEEAETLKDCPRYTDYREVLARKDVDAVMISSPDHWHVSMAVAAAKAGKDICCEKPLSLSIAAGRLLADTVAKHKCVFRTDSEFRSIRAFHRACLLVRAGKIGKLQTIRMAVPSWNKALPQQPEMPVPKELEYDLWLGPAPMKPYTVERVHPNKSYGRPGWYANQDYCDGVIVNWGHHLADVSQWANDTDRTGPVEIEGTGEFPPADGLHNVLMEYKVQYKYANGVRLHYTYGKPFVRFEGTEGWINVQYGPDKFTAEPASLVDAKVEDPRFPLKNEKRDFIDCVKSRSQTMEDAEVGHRSTSLCQLGYIAVQTGEKLKWDPAKERFLNSDAANKLLTRPPGRKPWGV